MPKFMLTLNFFSHSWTFHRGWKTEEDTGWRLHYHLLPLLLSERLPRSVCQLLACLLQVLPWSPKHDHLPNLPQTHRTKMQSQHQHAGHRSKGGRGNRLRHQPLGPPPWARRQPNRRWGRRWGRCSPAPKHDQQPRGCYASQTTT